jgi:hypothetical protein
MGILYLIVFWCFAGWALVWVFYFAVDALDRWLAARSGPRTWGFFYPEQPEATWLPDDDNLQLDADFSFVQEPTPERPFGWMWTAPAGAITNGDSFPRFFWRLTGAPLNNKGRRAAVLHDYYCDSRGGREKLPSWAVHLLFWRMNRACGVGPVRSWCFWFAVRFFGPQWK